MNRKHASDCLYVPMSRPCSCTSLISIEITEDDRLSLINIRCEIQDAKDHYTREAWNNMLDLIDKLLSLSKT